MTKFDRIVPVADLPPSLWRNATLYMAPRLAEAYRDVISWFGLTQLAAARSATKSPIGGLTKDAANEHFAQAFDGSVARSALAFLDPNSQVVHVADALARACAGGRLALLDLPSGAGAFSLSVLSALGELRATGTVPRQPLQVVVVGGEINSHAREHAERLFEDLTPKLAEQAIDVTYKPLRWDVCDPDSTAEILKRFVADADLADHKVVAVSNFTGFLARSGKQREAEPQLDNVFRLSSGPNSICVWIEPQTNVATAAGGVLRWVSRFVHKKLPRVARLVALLPDPEAPDQPYATTQAKFALPLTPAKTAVARLAVLRFDLPGLES